MKAGRYYVGDLCYVLRDSWEEVCNTTIYDIRTVKNGVFTLSDGREFALFSTAYGDGMYSDNYDNEYPVDSGSIGCILASDVDTPAGVGNGNVIDFPTDFEPYIGGEGRIVFGPVVIDTIGEDSEEWESDEWEDFDDFEDEDEDE
jgi:hypothetical protein